MKRSQFTITVICLFCGAPLQGSEDAEYSSGDLIDCLECGEGNDYDSVLVVAAEKGIKQVKSDVETELTKQLKSLFRGKP